MQRCVPRPWLVWRTERAAQQGGIRSANRQAVGRWESRDAHRSPNPSSPSPACPAELPRGGQKGAGVPHRAHHLGAAVGPHLQRRLLPRPAGPAGRQPGGLHRHQPVARGEGEQAPGRRCCCRTVDGEGAWHLSGCCCMMEHAVTGRSHHAHRRPLSLPLPRWRAAGGSRRKRPAWRASRSARGYQTRRCGMSRRRWWQSSSGWGLGVGGWVEENGSGRAGPAPTGSACVLCRSRSWPAMPCCCLHPAGRAGRWMVSASRVVVSVAGFWICNSPPHPTPPHPRAPPAGAHQGWPAAQMFACCAACGLKVRTAHPVPRAGVCQGWPAVRLQGPVGQAGPHRRARVHAALHGGLCDWST